LQPALGCPARQQPEWRAFPAHSLDLTNTCMLMWLSCVEGRSNESAKRTPWLLWPSLFLRCFLVALVDGCDKESYWDHRERRHQYARLHKWRTSILRAVLNWQEQRWQAVVITRLDFMSSMTEALISKVFKRPVLWDRRFKDYHNRDFVDKEWRNLSRIMPLYSVYTQIYVKICRTWFMWLHSVMMTLNYCTSPVASTCHGTEPAGLWKNPQNRSRFSLAEVVTELCILHFLDWVPLICNQAATIVWRNIPQTLNVW